MPDQLGTSGEHHTLRGPLQQVVLDRGEDRPGGEEPDQHPHQAAERGTVSDRGDDPAHQHRLHQTQSGRGNGEHRRRPEQPAMLTHIRPQRTHTTPSGSACVSSLRLHPYPPTPETSSAIIFGPDPNLRLIHR